MHFVKHGGPWLTAVAAAAMLGCGGDSGGARESARGNPAPGGAPPAASPPAAAAPESRTPAAGDRRLPDRNAVVERESGFCDLIAQGEVAGAFRAKLPMGDMLNINTGCVVPVQLGDREGNAVRFGPLSRTHYESYKKYEGQDNVDFEWIQDLGKEAFLINQNQLQILGKDDQPYIVALQLVLPGASLPLTRDEIRDGVLSLGRLLMSRIQQ